ncbi:MAG: hypothetical protein AAF549_05010 [Pseudomonadota bacterium]
MRKLSLLFGLIFLVGFVDAAFAMKIIPPRLVLDPDTKVEYLFIKNSGDTEEIYRFGWKHMAMDKEGNVINVDRIGLENAPEGYQPLDDIVRFSPRRAVLKPGQTQRVTLVIQRSQQLEAGEYRSHFLVSREPKVETKEDLEINENGEATPEVAVGISVSRAVPIYVLHGETSAELNFLSAEVKRNTNKQKDHQPDHLVHFKVQKVGNRSVIGVARVFCTIAGEEVEISRVPKIFAVYAEGEFRNEVTAVDLPSQNCSSYRLDVKAHQNDLLSGQQLISASF